jgi:magnesium transporter
MVINRDIQLAIVLGLAMIFSLTVAGFSGTLVPLIMHKLGKDPAASATVFITTVTDVFGFMAFLGLASLVMG